MSSFSSETEFTKFVGDEIARARSRHHSRRRRIPMPASSRHRARCNRHEARAGIVALISCCLVQLSNGGLCPPMRLSHYQRARGEVSSDPPGPAGFQRRWARPQQSSVLRCQFFTRPRELGQRTTRLRPQKISSPHGSVHPLVPQLYRFSIGSPHVWRTTFAILRTRRAWRRHLILSCDPTTVARLRSQNSASQTGLHTATLLSGSQISFRSVRGREGRKSRKAHRRQTPVEQP